MHCCLCLFACNAHRLRAHALLPVPVCMGHLIIHCRSIEGQRCCCRSLLFLVKRGAYHLKRNAPVIEHGRYSWQDHAMLSCMGHGASLPFALSWLIVTGRSYLVIFSHRHSIEACGLCACQAAHEMLHAMSLLACIVHELLCRLHSPDFSFITMVSSVPMPGPE